jgi:hypothetical protein
MKHKFCPECGIGLNTNEQQLGFCQNCKAFWREDNDEDDWREEMEERREEELAERAATCKCGAWQFAKDGSVIHVADCCCGAE